MPRLLIIKGADEGKQFELTEPVVTIGRDATNGIRLHDTEVSRRHAEVRQTPDGFELNDVGSANGCFINNQKTQHADLAAGDHIAIGQTVLVFSMGRDDNDTHVGELAEQINIITKADVELSSAIIKSIGEAEGSRILLQPEKNSPWLKARPGQPYAIMATRPARRSRAHSRYRSTFEPHSRTGFSVRSLADRGSNPVLRRAAPTANP